MFMSFPLTLRSEGKAAQRHTNTLLASQLWEGAAERLRDVGAEDQTTGRTAGEIWEVKGEAKCMPAGMALQRGQRRQKIT